MGKWWKCRTCQAFNLMGRKDCGWCNAPFIHQQTSSPSNPIHSKDCVPPKGSGKSSWSSGSGSYGSYWNQWPSQSQSSQSKGNQSAPSGKGLGNSRSSSVGSHQVTSAAASGANAKNFWQRRKFFNSQSTVNVEQESIVNGDKDAESEANSLMEKMDTLQAMINSLKSRTDQCSVEMKNGLEKDLLNLRIQKTQLKSLADQALVLETLILKRTTSLEEAERILMEQTASRDQIKQELVDAKSQLQSVLEQKSIEDAARFPNGVNGQQQMSPGNLFKDAQEMASMLPSDKATVFVECLSLLAQLMKQEKQDSADGFGQMDFEDNVFENNGGADLPYVPQMPFTAAPTTPGVTTTDPYGGARTNTPPRNGRARSLEPSPTQARSRSFSGRGKRIVGKRQI
jgi:hypothetical protein